jgi:hypothetical protein
MKGVLIEHPSPRSQPVASRPWTNGLGSATFSYPDPSPVHCCRNARLRSVNHIRIVNRPSRRHHHSYRLIVAFLVLPALVTSACSGTNTEPRSRPTAAETADPPTPSATTPTAADERPSDQPTTEEPDTVTTIRITVGDQTISAQLTDNATARDLVAQLPLTLNIRDFNGVEKIAALPRPLTMNGVPAGDDPDVNDIGYYAPSNDLVFYYGEVGYFNGIVRIGQASSVDIDLIERQRDGTQITIEQA